ncbi:MAG: class I SAM-dependent rRNA methyltransferase [Bacteroidota bacterium]|nr:class I SAM-dependent rRNA methyltransferase [Bacteroidota bacterium]
MFHHNSPHVILFSGKEVSLMRKHPWIFSGAISKKSEQLSDGDLVSVFSKNLVYLGFGHYHDGSISVRMLSIGPENYAHEFWNQKMSLAWSLRKNLNLVGNVSTDCFRWIHGEGDGLSGLIIDVYGDIAVIQCHSIGMHRMLDTLIEEIKRIASDNIHHIIDKSKETLPRDYSANLEDKIVFGNKNITQVIENNIHFEIDCLEGQKTGFFLDQRENRFLLGMLAKDAEILNAFCYTGGFSLYALQHKAKKVCSVDISTKALDNLKDNVELNPAYSGLHEIVKADVINYLKLMDSGSFDIIVLDPPAFAKSLNKRHNAIQAYKRINLDAIKKIRFGGFLFTFSCSQVVTEDIFYKTVYSAAIESGRNVSVLKKLSQGQDHPVSMFHQEGSYLKGLLLQVQ